jgi:hypothetical protein
VDLVALADCFRSAASAQHAQQLQHQLAEDPDTTVAESFYSAVLQSSSIIDSDASDMGSFVDTLQPPSPPLFALYLILLYFLLTPL